MRNGTFYFSVVYFFMIIPLYTLFVKGFCIIFRYLFLLFNKILSLDAGRLPSLAAVCSHTKKHRQLRQKIMQFFDKFYLTKERACGILCKVIYFTAWFAYENV